MLSPSNLAPNFQAPDQNGNIHTLSDFQGKYLILYFYPKDDTPSCTKEACSFQDNYHYLLNLGVQIIGVSADSIDSHLNFANKYHLTFPLLSDPQKNIIQSYQAGGLLTKRITYLINPKGLIQKVYPNVNPTTHSQELIDEIQVLIKSAN